jgi:O-antigen ligase
LWNPELRAVGDYADRSADRASLASYLQEHPRELLIGTGPGNFHWYEARRITYNFFGHNSYLHWTGELGIGGLILLLSWCFSVCMYAATRRKSQSHIASLAAGTCLAIVTGRMVTAWGSESLFGTQGMGGYSLYLVGIVYLLVSIISDASLPRLSLPRTTKVLRNMSV